MPLNDAESRFMNPMNGPQAIGTGSPADALAGRLNGQAGGLTKAGVLDTLDPVVEHGFWQSTYYSRPYIKEGDSYEQFGPAYQYGWESRVFYDPRTFAEVELFLIRDWSAHQGKSNLSWDKARQAVRDSWNRIDQRYLVMT